MGSLIPSEFWDWRTDWPKAAIAVLVAVVLLLLVVLISVLT